MITRIEDTKLCVGWAGRPDEATHQPSPAPLACVPHGDPRVAGLGATEVAW